MIGQRFGYLEVLSRSPNSTYRKPDPDWWECRCDCGQVCIRHGSRLRTGQTQSCGCTRKRVDAKRHHPLYPIWNGIVTRCHNPQSKDYARWGGRGIFVDKRWRDFWNFVADMGERPPNKQVERRDDDGPYSNDNCYWATAKEQARNRRNNRRLTINGETRLIIEWSELSGTTYNTILTRLDKWGFTPHDAVFKPLRHQGNRKPRAVHSAAL